MTYSATVTPNPKAYGSVSIGSSATQSFTVTNTGSQAFTPASVHVAGNPAFTIESDTCTGVSVGTGLTCTFTGRFTPPAPGAYAATIELLADVLTTIPTTDVTGTGPTGPAVTSLPTSWDAGVISVADTVDEVFTITNTGDSNLTIGTPAVSGDTQFTKVADTCSGQVIASAGTCEITVRFTPTDSTDRSGTLSIPSDDPSTPYTIALLGDAIDEGASTDPDIATAKEPTWAQSDTETVKSPGTLAATASHIAGGSYNGWFRSPPEDTTANLDLYTSVTGSNFLPGWQFVQASNTTITAKWVNDNTGGSVQFTMTAGSAGDTAYIQTVVPVGGVDITQIGYVFSSYWDSATGGGRQFHQAQYLRADGSYTGAMGSPSALFFPPGGLFSYPGVNSRAPTDAAYLLVRIGIERGASAVGATGTWMLGSVAVTPMPSVMRLIDYSNPTTYGWAEVAQYAGVLTVLPGAVGTDGIISLQGGLVLPNIIYAAVTATKNDYSPTGWQSCTMLALDPDAARTITGFAAPTNAMEGTEKYIRNDDAAFSITLTHQDAASSASNRMVLPNNASVVIRPRASFGMVWDDDGAGANYRWRPKTEI